MAASLENVNPGDLIQAEDWNRMVDCVTTLDERVTDLEAGGAGVGQVVITALSPVGSLRVGDTLTVFGTNFEFSFGAHEVFIDSERITAFLPGSNDSRLIFEIPPIDISTPGGQTATLQVSNRTSSAQVPITLLSEEPVLQGLVNVLFLSVDPSTPAADAPVTFQYQIQSLANLTADFTITPTISTADNPDEWESRLQVLDENLNVITSRVIPRLEPNETRVFHVRLTEVPDVADGTEFSLTVGAASGNVSGTSGARTFIVGEETEPQDDTITLSFLNAEFIGDGSVMGSTITLASGAQALVELRAEFTVIGTYDVSVQLGDATTGWTAEIFSNTTPTAFTINESDLDNTEERAIRDAEFLIQAGDSASASGNVEFRLQRSGAEMARTLEMLLARG